MNDLRQIVLDTETTGLNPGVDRIVEIGCVELVNRRLTHVNYHQYINPQMAMPLGAYEVHGLDDDFLADKPLFEGICAEFLEYVRGAQLVIHNASFDISFLDAELNRLDPSLGKMTNYCEIIDSLAKARELHPGQRNDLDSLAKRYNIDNSHRKLHGALLDSEILADVYLLMTGGQSSLSLDHEVRLSAQENDAQKRVNIENFNLPVVMADETELSAHQQILLEIEKNGAEPAMWAKFSLNDKGGVDG